MSVVCEGIVCLVFSPIISEMLRWRGHGLNSAAAPRPELVELTSLPADEAAEWFYGYATHAEHTRAARLGATRASTYVHAHGALHRRFAQQDKRFWSLSYGRGRAWAALSDQPVGVDVVDADDDKPLDPTFASLAECEAVVAHTLAFPPQLAVWAAKEATAKLTALVAYEPEIWRVQCNAGVIRVSSDDGHGAVVVFVALEAGLLAAVAQAQ